YFVVSRQDEPADGIDIFVRLLSRGFEYCGLCSFRLWIHHVQDRALVLADNGSVRLAREVAYRRRMPVITASHGAISVHALLNHDPFTVGGNHETVKVKLESVLDRVVVHPRGQAAAAHQR